MLATITAGSAFGQLQYSVSGIGDSFVAGGASFAYGLNNLGQVVGAADSNGYANAFLWSPSSGSMQNLGTLGGAASSADGINNAGQVVGQALTGSGVGQAFLYSGGSMQNLGACSVQAAAWPPASTTSGRSQYATARKRFSIAAVRCRASARSPRRTTS